jgi:hypothetical protein
MRIAAKKSRAVNRITLLVNAGRVFSCSKAGYLHIKHHFFMQKSQCYLILFFLHVRPDPDLAACLTFLK